MITRIIAWMPERLATARCSICKDPAGYYARITYEITTSAGKNMRVSQPRDFCKPHALRYASKHKLAI